MAIAFFIYGIIGNLLGEKFVWGTDIIGLILAILSLGALASICVIILAPAILRAGYETIKPMLVGFFF